MKKYIGILGVFLILFVTGCGNDTARSAVESYLKKYKTLDSEVLVDLENIITKEDLTDSQKTKYRDILKKQYKDIGYEIIEEEYDDSVSYVTAKVKVYDLYRAQRDAKEYLELNPDEFNDDNNIYSEEKYIDYKLDRMKDMIDRIEYTIVFTVTKENDKYIVSQPTENDLKKIHGIYNYDVE